MAPRKRQPFVHLTARAAARRDLWWKGAVIYQVYPRSFQDSDGDGVGDLPGITRRLEYIEQLGVDAIWISPFCKSPMKDYGYDVADYCAVDPLFGTLADFDALLAEAHRLGLKVMMDFVPQPHQRPASPGSRRAGRAATTPRPTGTSGPTPSATARRPATGCRCSAAAPGSGSRAARQYYLHNFLKEQPDLNFHNPQVIEALLAQARFWLERGVDGFRARRDRFRRPRPQAAQQPAAPRCARSAAAPPARPSRMQVQQLEQGPARADRAVPQAAARADRALRRQGGPGRDQRRRRAPARRRVHQRRRPRHRLQLRSAELPAARPRASAPPSQRLEKTIGRRLGLLVVQQPRRPPRRHPLGRRRPARGPAPAGAGAAGQLARHGLPLPGRGAGPGGGRRSPSSSSRTRSASPSGPPSPAATAAARPCPGQATAPEAGFTAGEPWLPIPESHRRRAVDVQDPDAGLGPEQHPRLPQLAPRAAGAADRRDPASCARTATCWRSSATPRPTGCSACSTSAASRRRYRSPTRRTLDAGFRSEGTRFNGRTVELPPWGFAFAHLD